MPRHSKDTVAVLGIEIGKNTLFQIGGCGRPVHCRTPGQFPNGQRSGPVQRRPSRG